ncbi:hypothetical protein GQ44DRAFT_779829 [Phaeosphaeriaceae sp. PMI808]|nr:hypothetical protein GQ44DRAFT_779829 [Phaeosphaeriaceae sp. PMI808]
MADDVANEVTDTIAHTITALKGVEKAYNKSEETKDLPDAFHEVLKRVELVKGTLKRVEGHVSEHDHDKKSCQEMKSDVKCCELERYREVARGLGGVDENRVGTLMIGLLEDVQSLVAKCVIERDGNVIEAVGKDQVEELAKAIEVPSAMQPSLEDASGNSINNWSKGTQNINTGKGTQNNNTGSGKQFIGEKQYFGKED